MATLSPRPLWPVLASLAATALLSFVAGGMVTALMLSAEDRPVAVTAPSPAAAVKTAPVKTAEGKTAEAKTAEAERNEGLRLALAPAERIGAAEAALLAPELFTAPSPPSREAPSYGLYTVQVGTYLRADLAEQARRNAEALGLAANTRLQLDERGRAWYSVQAGRYGDRLSAALAARSFDGAHAVSLSDPVSSGAWSRG